MKIRNSITSMTMHRASTKTVVPVAALLLLLGATIAVAQRFEPSVTRATVCVKDNGLLRMVTGGATACDSSEQPVEWVVGGEVTDVRVGKGLAGTRKGGQVTLGLDPAFLETCAGCGRIVAGFADGPASIPRGNGDELVPVSIAGLDLPPGNFAIFAKMTLRNVDSGDDLSHPVRCMLSAGLDSDEATVVVEDEQDRDGDGVPERDGATSLVMSLMVVRHFEAGGSAVLYCADGSPFYTSSTDGDVQYEDLKIIAVEAASISNVFLGN